MSAVGELNVNPEVGEEKPIVVLHDTNDVASTKAVFSNMAGIQNEEFKNEENCTNSEPCVVIESVDDDDYNDIQEIKAELLDVNTSSGKTEDDDTNEDLLNSDPAHSEETVNAGMRVEINGDAGNTISTTTTTVAAVSDLENSMKTFPNSCEDGTGLEMEVKTVVVKKKGRPRKNTNAASSTSSSHTSAVRSNGVETAVWETVEQVVDLTSGVRRSGRKRKQKRISSYIDLLEDNVDSYSNCSGKSDDEWNYEAETKSFKTEVEDPSPPPSPALPSVRKAAVKSKSKRKVAIRRPLEDKSSGEGSKKNRKSSKEEESVAENEVGEMKKEKRVEKFRCKACGMVFLSRHQFKNHQLTCNDIQSLGQKVVSRSGGSTTREACPVCKKVFAKRAGVKRHMSTNHTHLVHISCALCNKRIGDIDDNYRHFQKEHQSSLPERKNQPKVPGTAICPVCGESVGKKHSHMKVHLTNQHSNLIRVTCALCQRSVGTILEYLQHFLKYHSHSSLVRDKNGEVVTTNTDTIKKMDPSSKSSKTGNEGTSVPMSSPSVTEKSDLICLQCNKSIDNHKLLVLHMLSHKVEENTDVVSQSLKAPSSNTTSAGSNHQADPSSSNPNSRPSDEYPFPVYWLPPENLGTVSSVSGMLGPDLLMALNRSLNLMTDMSTKLKSELVWGDSDSFCSKEDLLRKMNLVLKYSSGITDVGKCLLLVMEESQQLNGNPYAAGDEVVEDYEAVVRDGYDVVMDGDSDVLSVASKEDNHDDDNGSDPVRNDDIGDDDRDKNQSEGNNVLSHSENDNETDKDNAEIEDAIPDSSNKETSNEVKTMTSNINTNTEYSQLGNLVLTSMAGQESHDEQAPTDGDNESNLEIQNAEQSEPRASRSSSKSESASVKSVEECVAPLDSERRSSQRLKAKANTVTTKKGKKGKKKYICNKCGKHVAKKYRLVSHMLTHSDLRPFDCRKCTASFKSEEHLRKHLLVHLKDGKFKCDFCDYSNRIRSLVQKHSLEEHPNEDLFSCDLCKHKARTSHDLEIHKRIHMPKKCKHCDFEAKHLYELKTHERKNHANKFCSYCSFSCIADYQLRRHMKTHVKLESDKIFCCELCGATFDSNRKLQYHVVRHTNKKPLSCSQCDYRCSSKSSLDAHMMKHSGLRPYKCNLCDKAFYKAGYLKQHKRMHSDEKAYSCRYCGKGFKYPYNCQEHEMIHTGEKKFKCKLCNFACRRRKFLEQHLEEHRARGSDVEGLSGCEDNDNTVIEEADDGIISGLNLETDNLVPIL